MGFARFPLSSAGVGNKYNDGYRLELYILAVIKNFLCVAAMMAAAVFTDGSGADGFRYSRPSIDLSKTSLRLIKNADSNPTLDFISSSDIFLQATKEYEGIWRSDGQRIETTLEQVSGLSFKEKTISAIIYEDVSYAGHLGEPLYLRASYPFEIKKEALVHELGHKLQFDLPLTEEIDLHRALFLFLYDVWTDLYGIDFANKSVAAEKIRKGGYDYAAAWNWALSFSRTERAKLLADLRAGKLH